MEHIAVNPKLRFGFANKILSCLLFVVLLFSIGSAQVVPRGGSGQVPLPGTSLPANGQAWDILNPSGTIIATASVPNGWSVGVLIIMGTMVKTTVGCPYSTPIGSPYTVRKNVSNTGFSGTFAVLQADPPLALRDQESESESLVLDWDRLFLDRRLILA